MRTVLVIGFSFLLLSCAMGPDYERPTTEMEDRFRMAGASEDLPSLANLSWWELLRDEQLQQLIRTA
ncbi:MAG: transporter, partial [Nitrospira sp.]|nr:transporter [Nitrospira sp.]